MTYWTSKSISIVALLIGTMALGSCSVISGPKNDTFELTKIAPVKGPNSRRRQIVVTDPSAVKSLDGSNIVVRTSPSAIQYLARSQWNDNLPKLVQQNLVDAFEDSGRLGGVGKPGDGIAVDYLVSPTIRSFEIISNGTDTAVVEISVRIINDRNGVVKAQRVFQSTAAAAGVTNADFIDALDRANGKIMNDIVAWALKII
ncbi:MAG: ABC-type transport auxiliary lipoprotein family protein [Rhizobiaceae bacterium]|nr:ABC-type transport auxiliary lipoprotein family protein [Rhizobiaceae bacterium]